MWHTVGEQLCKPIDKIFEKGIPVSAIDLSDYEITNTATSSIHPNILNQWYVRMYMYVCMHVLIGHTEQIQKVCIPYTTTMYEYNICMYVLYCFKSLYVSTDRSQYYTIVDGVLNEPALRQLAYPPYVILSDLRVLNNILRDDNLTEGVGLLLATRNYVLIRSAHTININ